MKNDRSAVLAEESLNGQLNGVFLVFAPSLAVPRKQLWLGSGSGSGSWDKGVWSTGNGVLPASSLIKEAVLFNPGILEDIVGAKRVIRVPSYRLNRVKGQGLQGSRVTGVKGYRG